MNSPRTEPETDASARSETSFRALVDGMPDAVIVHRDGRMLYANTAARRLLGYEHDTLVGRALDEITPPEERDVVRQRSAQILGSADLAPFREARIVRRDGSTTMVEVTGLAVQFDGAPAVASIAHDVTEKRQMLAQLAQRDRLASMGMLAASVAHEINNPITYVLLNLERLIKELPDAARAFASLREEVACTVGEEEADIIFSRARADRALAAMAMLVERVTTAAEGARQVGRIARDLRAFARVEEDERAGVDVNALLDKVLDLAANELRFRASVLREYGPISVIQANESRLSQVFLNLVVNAAHAIGEGAPERNVVTVRTSLHGRDVRIEIADTGHGIEKEHMARLFDPFFTTKAKGQGSGLGLSICRDIVQSHGGRIDVVSEPGRGSQFTVFLPVGVAADTFAAPPSSTMPRVPLHPHKPRVLIIDDERTLRSTLQVLLSDAYDVILADSGAAAFEVLATDRAFDVVLCDLMMPEVSGMQVHAWVQREAPDLLPRMVFMTGGAFTRNASEFLEQIVNRYLEKPFEVQELIEVLDRVARKGVSRRPGV